MLTWLWAWLTDPSPVARWTTVLALACLWMLVPLSWAVEGEAKLRLLSLAAVGVGAWVITIGVYRIRGLGPERPEPRPAHGRVVARARWALAESPTARLLSGGLSVAAGSLFVAAGIAGILGIWR